MNVLSDLESAATIMMAPPSAVSADDRKSAENVFLNFRRTRKPYDICKSLFETSRVDYVLFEAATTIKEAMIREWTILSKEEIDSVCQFLLHCATEKHNLQPFVREQILQVVAIIFKLGTLDEAPEARTKLISGLSQLVATHDQTMEMICSSIMKALLTEYSTTNQSTNFGMSFEFHYKCKKAFEKKDLRNIFVLTIQTLQRYMSAGQALSSRQHVAVFNRFLSLAEQILQWEFLSGNPLSLLRFQMTTSEKILFRPHRNWRPLVLDDALLDLFFKIQAMCSANSELSHHALQCLIQLASLVGSVFKDDGKSEEDAQAEYLSRYINGFLNICSKEKWTGHEALGFANVVFRIVDVFSTSVLKSLNRDSFHLFLEATSFLCCTFLDAAVTEEQSLLDDNEYTEAANMILSAWVNLISHVADLNTELFTSHSMKIFNVYLNTHIGPPDGVRPKDSDDEIDIEIEVDDREACSDELSDIGCLARQAVPFTVPALTERLEQRDRVLKDLLEHVRKDEGVADSSVTENLFEDIHWLLLISSFVIASDSPGETDLIPAEINLATNKHLVANAPHGVTAACSYIMSDGGEGDATTVDPIVRLITIVLRMAVTQTEFVKAGQISSISPEVVATCMWFLRRFANLYLCADNPGQPNLNPMITGVFGADSVAGKWMVGKLLEVVEVNLKGWSTEPRVSEDVVQLLLAMFSGKKRASLCLGAFPQVWTIAGMFHANHVTICALSPSVHRQLVHAFMKASSQLPDCEQRKQLQDQFISPIIERYQQLRTSPNFTASEPRTRSEVIRTFESFRGLVTAKAPTIVDATFLIVEPILRDATLLLNEYATSAEIVDVILELFVDATHSLAVLVNRENFNSLCEICLAMMQQYLRCELNVKPVVGDDGEVQCGNLLLLIKLLSNILQKDILDFDSEDDPIQLVSVVDVVLFGLNIIVPLLNTELLKFPKLSNEYFKLITFVCEVYPEKMKSLPAELFQSLMASLNAAIFEYGDDVSKWAMDAISNLAKYISRECDRTDADNKQLSDALQYFLNLLFQHVVTSRFNVDLIESAAECMFLLICCHADQYLQLANQLIEQQHVTDEQFKERLISAFQELTPPDLPLQPDRLSLKKFRKNLEVFLRDVKGFLCFK